MARGAKTTKTKTKELRLPWRDCECGCHGNTLKLGSRFYWYIYRLDSKTSELRDGHGSLSEILGTFKNGEGMAEFIQREAVPRLQEEKKKVEADLALFAL